CVRSPPPTSTRQSEISTAEPDTWCDSTGLRTAERRPAERRPSSSKEREWEAGKEEGKKKRAPPPRKLGSGALLQAAGDAPETGAISPLEHRELLGDLGDAAGADGTATLADGEAQALVHRDRLDQGNGHVDVVARHDHLDAL